MGSLKPWGQGNSSGEWVKAVGRVAPAGGGTGSRTLEKHRKSTYAAEKFCRLQVEEWCSFDVFLFVLFVFINIEDSFSISVHYSVLSTYKALQRMVLFVSCKKKYQHQSMLLLSFSVLNFTIDFLFFLLQIAELLKSSPQCVSGSRYMLHSIRSQHVLETNEVRLLESTCWITAECMPPSFTSWIMLFINCFVFLTALLWFSKVNYRWLKFEKLPKVLICKKI